MTPSPGDGLPWYRHAWAWLVFGLLAVSIVGSLTTVFLAYHGRDPLVGEAWYADGVAINDELARRRDARAAGIRARVRFETEPARIRVELTGEGIDEVVRLDLRFGHATNARLDRHVELVRIGPGLYEAVGAPLVPGRFYATLEPGPDLDAVSGSGRERWKLTRAFRSDATNTLELGGEG